MNTHYRLVPADPAAHVFEITLTVAEPDPVGQVLRLPAWIPGSYTIREFAKNIVQIRATSHGEPVALHKVDKDTWQADPCEGPLVVEYEVYAWDLTVRTAHFDGSHAFFNGTSVFLQAVGVDGPCHVTLEPPPHATDWRVATTLPEAGAPRHGFGDYQAADYDELIDHPVEMGTWDLYTFTANGIPHEVAITGVHDTDGDRLVADLKAICEQHLNALGAPPDLDRYLFQVMAVGNGYGGLEHRTSTALICKRDDLPQRSMEGVSDGYRTFMGLCSHEYFHTWNVKRIKPALFAPYDLSRETHTTMLWAFEGITSYFDDLGLLQSDRIDIKSYLELLGMQTTRVLRSDGRHVQSVSDSSFDAWTKFYHQDENARNSIISYYTKGSLVALCLDLILRRDSEITLMDLLRSLFEDDPTGKIGVPEDGVERRVQELSGLDLREFFDLAVRGTKDLPMAALLEDFGVALRLRPSVSATDRGGKKADGPFSDVGMDIGKVASGVKIKSVRRGGPAHQCGLSAGDVIIAVEGLRAGGDLRKRLAARAPGSSLKIHAFRRDELRSFDLVVGEPHVDTAWLELLDVDGAALQRRTEWLGG